MTKENVSSNKKTQEELEQELKHDLIVKREISNTVNYRYIMALMDKIEQIRQEPLNISRKYSQKELAERAGIGLSTYKDYLSGASDNIKLKTVINIAHVLQCELSDLIDGIDKKP